jgi:hypothetical protein
MILGVQGDEAVGEDRLPQAGQAMGVFQVRRCSSSGDEVEDACMFLEGHDRVRTCLADAEGVHTLAEVFRMGLPHQGCDLRGQFAGDHKLQVVEAHLVHHVIDGPLHGRPFLATALIGHLLTRGATQR